MSNFENVDDEKLLLKIKIINEIESKKNLFFDISKTLDINSLPDNKSTSFPYYDYTPYYRMLKYS
jgi:uncharacterized LabA/DUF88 family protein